MRIVAIHEKSISLSSSMRNASIGFGGMTASAVAVVSDVMDHGKPVVGFSFDSPGRYGHGGLLRERFIPRLLAADPDTYRAERGDSFDPYKIWSIVMTDEKPGGHGERPGAVGLIDAAVWDLVAKLARKPLWSLLAERTGRSSDGIRVPVYATCGHYHAIDDLVHLRDEVRRCVDLGFTRVKIKIGGMPLAEDRKRIEAAITVLGSGTALAVDCNGTLTKADASNLVRALEPYDLAWIEEPVDPLDFDLHKELAARCSTPLATGENLFSAADTLNLLRYGGLRAHRDYLQMDVSLSYGIVEYLRIVDLIEAHGWSRLRCLPHAGNLLAFNVVAGLGLGGHETAPLGNFALGLAVEDGFVRPSDAPGVGFERSPIFSDLFGDLVP